MKATFTLEISDKSALSLGKEGELTALIYPGNPKGNGTGGIAPAIKKAAGKQLVPAINGAISARLGEKTTIIYKKELYLPVTENVIIGACNLSSQGFSHIIYCAGPDYREKANDKEHAYTHRYEDKTPKKDRRSPQQVLTATYENALRAGLEQGVTHFVFPQISAGVFAGEEEARINRLTIEAIKKASEKIVKEKQKTFSITLSCFSLDQARKEKDFEDLSDIALFHGLIKEKNGETTVEKPNASAKKSYRDILTREREEKNLAGFSRG